MFWIITSSAESLFQDKQLSHHINFAHLPPINLDGSSLGDYPSLGQGPMETIEHVMSELDGFESHRIKFSETSIDNNLVMQCFDVRDSSVIKLDIVDFGEFPSEKQDSTGKHV